MFKATIVFFFIFFFLLIGMKEAEGQDKQKDFINSMCPILTSEPIEEEYFVEYHGNLIGLCCLRCKRNFLKNPKEYLANLPSLNLMEVNLPKTSKSKKNKEVTNKHHHKTNHKELSELDRLIRFLGKFHPVAVHFPIALLLIAGLLEVLASFTKKELFYQTARLNILFSAVFSTVAVILGWFAGEFATYPDDSASILTLHRWFGVGTAILIIITAILSEKMFKATKENNKTTIFLASYRFFLALSCIFVGVTGHFGGTLIFGNDYFRW